MGANRGTGDRHGRHGQRLRRPAADPLLFVRGAEVIPVERRTSSVTIDAALTQLVKGPTLSEVGTGIRTALPPEVIWVERGSTDGLTSVGDPRLHRARRRQPASRGGPGRVDTHRSAHGDHGHSRRMAAPRGTGDGGTADTPTAGPPTRNSGESPWDRFTGAMPGTPARWAAVMPQPPRRSARSSMAAGFAFRVTWPGAPPVHCAGPSRPSTGAATDARPPPAGQQSADELLQAVRTLGTAVNADGGHLVVRDLPCSPFVRDPGHMTVG